MPAAPFAIPEAVVDWIRDVFAQVNLRSSSTLSRIPTTWETTLDHGLIGHLAEFAAPFRFSSNWVVNLETHFIGGGRFWGSWEIADIGILIIFRQRGHILGTKLALLQSKRLYPDEIESATDALPIDYRVGFARLLATDSEYRSSVKTRAFHFSRDSRYRALEFAAQQYSAILDYTNKHGIPVHYQLYNPVEIPWMTELPADANGPAPVTAVTVGCRVINAVVLHEKLQRAALSKGQHPSFVQVAGMPKGWEKEFWSLQHFVADLVIGCKEGYLAGTNPVEDEGLFRVFNLRSGPMSAAISINIDAPG
ncbi:MAG: hypothetical protein K2X35_01105 [Bryobacteraceae bacterium]|nr:hypothetical protein [Bryobacteraceae bacterium]